MYRFACFFEILTVATVATLVVIVERPVSKNVANI